MRDGNDPDGFRYDGGSYVTRLEIPFESAALNQVVAVLDHKVAERKDFEKRLENGPIGNYFISLSDEAKDGIVSVIMAHKEETSIGRLLEPLSPTEPGTENTQNIPGWLDTLISQLTISETREPGGNNNTFSPT